MLDTRFDRDLEVKVGSATMKMHTTDFSKIASKPAPMLRCVFKIKQNLDRNPNTANIQIYNLNSINRGIFQKGSQLAKKARELGQEYDWPLEIKAGYVGNLGTLFSGDIVSINFDHSALDNVSALEADDGGVNFGQKRIAKTFGVGAPYSTLLQACAKALGVGLGNSSTAFAKAGASQGLVAFKASVTIRGKVADILDTYVTSAGYIWSIQNGNLLVLSPTETALKVPVKLNPLDGSIIGTPEIGDNGYVKAKSLLNSDLTPGTKVVITSKRVQGSFRVESVEHYGDTYGNEWYSEFTGKPVL